MNFWINAPAARGLCLLGLLAVCAAAVAETPEANDKPGINRHYENADVAQWQRTFETESREVYALRKEIAAASGIRPGMAVADIGAGTGFFARLFAATVGAAGKVYAADISPEFVAYIQQFSREAKLDNLSAIQNTATDSGLAADSVDLVFTCDTYHHFEYPASMLQSIHRALRKDGVLVVVDYQKQPGVSSGWVMGHVRADKAAVIQEIQAAGFELLEDRSELLKENYLLRFRKK